MSLEDIPEHVLGPKVLGQTVYCDAFVAARSCPVLWRAWRDGGRAVAEGKVRDEMAAVLRRATLHSAGSHAPACIASAQLPGCTWCISSRFHWGRAVGAPVLATEITINLYGWSFDWRTYSEPRSSSPRANAGDQKSSHRPWYYSHYKVYDPALSPFSALSPEQCCALLSAVRYIVECDGDPISL